RGVVVKVIAELSKALVKVVEGQVADLEFEGRKYSKKDLEFIHLNKTASLIRASILCGAMIGGAGKSVMRKLERYGENLGMAFQIIDDILDITLTKKKLGKTPKKDIAQKKATYPRLIGLENSRKLAQLKIVQSIKALQGLGKTYNILRSIAEHLGERSV
ncbi:polyprenyl synthetase family protein, partial [Candidatus Margulisiibacteriota bacterium]